MMSRNPVRDEAYRQWATQHHSDIPAPLVRPWGPPQPPFTPKPDGIPSGYPPNALIPVDDTQVNKQSRSLRGGTQQQSTARADNPQRSIIIVNQQTSLLRGPKQRQGSILVENQQIHESLFRGKIQQQSLRRGAKFKGSVRGTNQVEGSPRGITQVEGSPRGITQVEGSPRGITQPEGSVHEVNQRQLAVRDVNNFEGLPRGVVHSEGSLHGVKELTGSHHGRNHFDGSRRCAKDFEGSPHDNTQLERSVHGVNQRQLAVRGVNNFEGSPHGVVHSEGSLRGVKEFEGLPRDHQMLLLEQQSLLRGLSYQQSLHHDSNPQGSFRGMNQVQGSLNTTNQTQGPLSDVNYVRPSISKTVSPIRFSPRRYHLNPSPWPTYTNPIWPNENVNRESQSPGQHPFKKTNDHQMQAVDLTRPRRGKQTLGQRRGRQTMGEGQSAEMEAQNPNLFISNAQFGNMGTNWVPQIPRRLNWNTAQNYGQFYPPLAQPLPQVQPLPAIRPNFVPQYDPRPVDIIDLTGDSEDDVEMKPDLPIPLQGAEIVTPEELKSTDEFMDELRSKYNFY